MPLTKSVIFQPDVTWVRLSPPAHFSARHYPMRLSFLMLLGLAHFLMQTISIFCGLT